MHRIRVAVALGAALAALSLPASTGALEPQSDVQRVPELPAQGEAKDAKLDSALARLADAEEDRARLVHVEAAARGARRGELEAAIRAAGGTTIGRYGGLVEARIPVRALELVANHPSARLLRTPARPYPQVVAGEGIASTGAGAWHTANTGGAGVEIAIIDVGFAGWQELPEDELPEGQVMTQNFCDSVPFEGDPHGTAVAEIVHEIAPAAKLHLICIDSIVSLGQAKDYVVANDIPIVNHSAGWPNTSRGDGTGGSATPEGIVAHAHAQGVLWVNAAGNFGEDAHWSGTFSDTDADDLHNFTATENANDVFLFEGGCVFLKWDDWPASNQDFDLYLFRASDGLQVAESEDPQTGSQEPVESVCVSEDDDYVFVIAGVGTTETPRLDVFVTGGGGLPYSIASGSIIEPATSPDALAVGAVCVHSNAFQGYSSRGPTIDGRTKPEISAQDANSGVTYGPATDCLTGFTGTSASSAHVAGAAALVKQASPSLDATGLQSALQQKAVDILPSGVDNNSGWGRLALGATPPVPAPAPVNGVLPSVTGLFHESQTLAASTGEWAGTPTLFAFRWLRCDAAGNGCVPIAGARSGSYSSTSADVGHVLRVRVTASNSGGSTQALSAGTPAIQGPIQPPASVIPPSLAGTAQFGQSLSASAGAWSGTAPITISIQWLRCDSAGGACAVIVGASSSTYVLALEDVGATIRIQATASNPAGSVSLISAPSGVVASQAPAIVPPSPPSPPPPGPAGGATPPPPQTTTQTRLVVMGFIRTPRTPIAGRKFTLVLRVGTRSVSARGATRRVTCSAKVGRRTLKPTKSLRAGVARCAWTIPRTAPRKRLRGVITVSEGTRSVRRTVTATVRGPQV